MKLSVANAVLLTEKEEQIKLLPDPDSSTEYLYVNALNQPPLVNVR